MTIYKNAITVARNDYLGGGSWTLTNLRDITVVVGKNGSGKSLLLRAWRNAAPQEVHYIVPERTGEIDFQPQYLQEEVSGTSRVNAASRNFTDNYRRRIVSRIQTYFMKRGNSRGNAIPLASPDDIEAMLNVLLPDFTLQLTVEANPPFKLTRNTTSQEITQVDHLSSGEAQLISVGLDALTIASIWEIESTASRVLLIDEPDAHIHPDLQARFADFLVKIAHRYKLQIVVATHSTALLSALAQFGGSETGIVLLTQGKHEYKVQQTSQVTQELTAVLGGHVLMGPLFGAPLLLVEGDDDYRIWSQVPRHHVVSVAVIPCTGAPQVKKYQKNLEQILSCLSDKPPHPVGFALLDGDMPLPVPNPDSPQTFVKFVRLGCRESENLYLADEILSLLGHTWMQAQELILAASGKYPAISHRLAGVASWDRGTIDLKGLMDALPAILDRKKLPWTTRVSFTVGRASPTGQLASFLGQELLGALWPPA
jgi:ABC-type cobalamin/Fe3+-siderophores transport system ATPase subunit